MRKTAFQALLGAILAAPLGASGQAQPSTTALDKSDQQIVVAMAQANMAEVEAGKIALANGHSADVKAFAQRMVDDHTKALGEVSALAQAKGIPMPKEVDAKHKALAEKLSKLKGQEFDRTYMAQAGVNDHKQVQAMLKKDAASAKDPQVKALAAKLLPTVEQHLHAAVDKHAAHKAK